MKLVHRRDAGRDVEASAPPGPLDEVGPLNETYSPDETYPLDNASPHEDGASYEVAAQDEAAARYEGGAQYEGGVAVWPSGPVDEPVKPERLPLYSRLLRLHHLRPNVWQRVLLGDGPIAAGVLLVLADLATAWTILALPVAVALMVKVNDVLAGVLADARPAGPDRLAWGVPASFEGDSDLADESAAFGLADDAAEPGPDEVAPDGVEPDRYGTDAAEPVHEMVGAAFEAALPARPVDDYPTAGMQERYRAAAMAAPASVVTPAAAAVPASAPSQRRGPARVGRRTADAGQR